MRAHGTRCYYCPSPATGTDHLEPLVRGGDPDDVRNLVPACYPCNTLKGQMTPEQWSKYRQTTEFVEKHERLRLSDENGKRIRLASTRVQRYRAAQARNRANQKRNRLAREAASEA
jgi:hypothetical protein